MLAYPGMVPIACVGSPFMLLAADVYGADGLADVYGAGGAGAMHFVDPWFIVGVVTSFVATAQDVFQFVTRLGD